MKNFIKIMIFVSLLFSFALYGAQAASENAVSASSSRQKEKIVTLDSHEVVTSVQLSPDGKLIASGDVKGNLIIRDANSYEQVRRLPLNSYIRSLAWSPDSKKIIAIYRDKKIVVWDVNLGMTLDIVEVEEMPICLAWSPDGGTIAMGSDKYISFYSLDDYGMILLKLKYEIPTFDAITTLSWSPDSQFLVSGSSGHSVIIWDILNSKMLQNEISNEIITSVAWSPDGKHIAFASKNQTVTIGEWDAGTKKLRVGKDKKIELGIIPVRTSWSADSKYIAIGLLNGDIRIYDVATKNVINIFKLHSEAITALQWPSRDIIISASVDKTIKILNKNRWLRIIGSFKADLYPGRPIVKRSTSGNFVASKITANLSGSDASPPISPLIL